MLQANLKRSLDHLKELDELDFSDDDLDEQVPYEDQATLRALTQSTFTEYFSSIQSIYTFILVPFKLSILFTFSFRNRWPRSHAIW